MAGGAEEFDQRMPFATLHSCLQRSEHPGSQTTKVLGLIQDGSAEYPVIEAALTLIEEWCAASPAAVAVEDLHWADPASILLLHWLGKVAGQLPLLLAADLHRVPPDRLAVGRRPSRRPLAVASVVISALVKLVCSVREARGPFGRICDVVPWDGADAADW